MICDQYFALYAQFSFPSNESIFARQVVKNLIMTNGNIVRHFTNSTSSINKLMELKDQLGFKKQINSDSMESKTINWKKWKMETGRVSCVPELVPQHASMEVGLK